MESGIHGLPLIRRSGYRRFRREITFGCFVTSSPESGCLCSVALYCDDIRYSPAWAFGPSGSDGRFVAAYRHNDPAKSRQYYYETQEEACARFLLGFVEQF